MSADRRADPVPFTVPPGVQDLVDPTLLVAVHVLLARHSGDWQGGVTVRGGGRTVAVRLDLPPDLSAGAAGDRAAVALRAAETPGADVPVAPALIDVADGPADPTLPVSGHDLVVSVSRTTDGGPAGQLTMAGGAPAGARVRDVATQLGMVWASALGDPTRPIGRLDLLPPAQLVAAVPGPSPAATVSPAEPVHRLVAAQARRTPESIAVTCGESRLTYAELCARAEAIAEALVRFGVRPADRVVVAVPRGTDLLAALLGVLHIGAAYVPLDPDHPPGRNAGIVADCAATAILTTAGAAPADRAVLLTDVPDRPASPVPGFPVTAGDVAYLIYTSGSTGRPKGVMVSHGSLSNFLASMRDRPGLPAGATLPAVTTVSFDIAALELFLPLLVGGTVALADRDEAREPDRLIALLRRVDARVLQATPVTWRLLLDAGWSPPAGFTALCGGERLPPELAARLCATGLRLWDLYGPTETTVWSSVTAVVDGTPAESAPVAATTLVVLDERLEPVPAGANGELHIGGAGVALGYHGRPALTAEKFIPDPYATSPGARLYRTGDVARRHGDGRVEIVGRTDDQVKIRGFRVEPGEVENVLAEHSGTDSVVVRAIAHADGDLRLVAFVRPRRRDDPPTPEELRAHCASRLPTYLVPTRYVIVERFPTTANGKIARNALTVPGDTTGPAPARAPQTPAERLVTKVFAETLGVGTLGPDDDFFLHGGDSVLAARAVSRLRAEFDADLPISALFEAPTAAALAGRLSASPRSAPAGPAPHGPGPAPLSHAQQAMWFLDQLDPGSTAYLEPLAVRLPGPMDLPALSAAIAQVIERHEPLRMRIRTGPSGEPEQIAEPTPAVRLAVEHDDLSRVLAEELARPIDLATEAPLRMRLVRTGPDDHTLLLVLHHIVTDDRSNEVLTAELLAAYRGAPLAPLPTSYTDETRRRHDRVSGAWLDREVAFWRDRLAGLQPTELPTDRARPPVPGGPGDSIRIAVPAALAQRLTAVGASRGATPFMTYLAGFFQLLAHRTGRTDLAVGVPVAGRDRPELENLVGLFVNTVVLRVDLSGASTFTEALAAVRAAAIATYDHDGLPFEVLVQHLAPRRDPGRNPLFNLMVTQHPTAPAGDLPVPGRDAKVDLSCHLTLRADGGLDVRLDFSTALFDTATMDGLARDYVRLLEAATMTPAPAPATDAEAPLVPRLIALRAATTPEATALTGAGGPVSYRELLDTAGRLANHLRDIGVRRGDRVLIRLPHSPDLVRAMLAIWLAGGAYVPIDPAHPPARLDEVARDAGAKVLIAAGGTVAPPQVALISVDDPAERAVVRGRPAEPPDIDITAADLAYVVYTSGSTGRPKGVMVTHGGLAAYCDWAVGTLRPDAGRGSPLHSSIAYDLALTALFPTLVAGATVTLVPAVDGGVDELADTFDGPAYAVLKLTPTHLDLLSAALPERAAAAARCLVVGGEPLRGEQLAAWRRLAPQTRLVNSYGPTEITIACCAYVAEVGDIPDGPVPIGSAIAGATLHVLGDDLRPAPPGTDGELHVGGPGVARGYLGRPALTAAAFVPDPYGPPGTRLYRTGDLVRRTPAGLRFLARRDDQVKIRGHRVEPGEAQALLAGHPTVRAAVVIATDPGPGDRRLAAHIVPAPGGADPAELRRFLADRLPGHAVPTLWSVLDSLPLLGNGKLDRSDLPAGEPIADDTTAHVAARTPAERVIAEVWAEVLRAERLGVHDDFFRMGGHSLLAARAVARLRDRLPVAPTLRDMFRAPTVAGLAAVLAARAAAEVAATFGAGGSSIAGTRTAVPMIPAADRAAPLPLSPAQQRLYFLDRLHPDSTDYLVLTALRLRGHLDVAKLAAALDRVIERHEILRTRYRPGPAGEPVQVVDPPRASLLVAEDGEPQSVITDELGRPVDLARGPVLRARLVRSGAEEHVLVLVVHHIATDGRSTAVLLADLDTAYRGGHQSGLPVQYADVAAWQRTRLAGSRTDADLAYWRARLAGLEQTELPTDRPRPAVRDAHGGMVRFSIDPHIADRLTELGRDAGATPFMTLLAGFFALLGRYTGGTGVAVGTPSSGRPDGADDLVGLFVNTIVLRADLTGDPPFSGLLTQVGNTASEAYEHAGLPFERLVEDLAPPRDPSRNPLFQLMFAVREDGATGPRLGDLTVTPEPAPARTSKFDFTVELSRRADGGFDGDVEYATALFEAATAERLAGHYVRLLTDASRRPAARLSELRMLGDAETGTLLHGWNPTARPRREPGLPELIAARVAGAPAAPAVDTGTETLSYAGLNARVERLAHRLRALGVRRDDVVAIRLPRSADLVVAVLAVLRAGAALLPLDPAHPAARSAWMLSDADCRFLVADAAVPGAEQVAVVDPAAQSKVDELDAPWPSTDPEALAYVIYTSGSTGRPKGVAVTHRGIHNRVLWAVQRFALGPADRMLQKTPITFDAAVWEILAPLVAGGTVVLAPPGAERDPTALVNAAAARGVTVLQAVPSLWRPLAEQPALARCTSLRLLFSAGERLPVELADRLAVALPQAELINTYGPTECAIDVTAWRFRRDNDDPAGAGTVPIGLPLDNTRAVVVAPGGGPVPVGVAGELLVSGDGLARGYLGRPALTAERFVPDPFGAPGARAYRTGDIVRRRPDGTIDFIGRDDDQVKIRGVRVEIGEVETVLGADPAVTSAAVVARPGPDTSLQLVAYVTGDADEADLRAHLAAQLPGPYVPSLFVFLDRLPLTTSGKVDRRALPDPAVSTGRRGPQTPPRTPAERLVAEVFAELLAVPGVARDDDFFGLGGHSLMAAKVVDRLAAMSGTRLPVRAVFEHPTVAALAGRLDEWTGKADDPVVAGRHDGPPPLSFAQQRMWFMDRLTPGDTSYHLAWTVGLSGELDLDSLGQALTGLLARHEVLRTRYPAGPDGNPVQVVEEPAPVALPVVDVAARSDSDADAAVRPVLDALAREPFDLAVAPPVRVHLLRTGPREHVLMICMHHIAGDGWSEDLLARDLGTLYALARDNIPAPAATGPSYAQHARRQQDQAAAGAFDGELAHWRARLAGLEPTDLPTDRPRPLVRDSRGATLNFTVPAEVATPLLAIGRGRGATAFMTFLAVFTTVLSRYAGVPDVAVGTPVAGRGRADLRDVIGLFVNTVVLRVSLAGEPSFTELLDRTREAALDAFARDDLPFNLLVQDLAPERDLSRSPLFDVMVELRDAAPVPPRLPGLEVRRWELPRDTAKFDLTLTLTGDGAGGYRGELEYATALFDEPTMRRLAEHLVVAATAAAATPGQPVSRLDLLTAAERHWILREWNPPVTEATGDMLPAEVLARAARTPAAVAVRDGLTQMTYADLVTRSAVLARRLRVAGAQAEATVAVLLDRSAAAVVTLLAVLRAGAAYVPLDAGQPADRIAALLDDLQPAVVVTDRAFLPRLAAHPGTTVLVDESGPVDVALPSVDPDCVAYMIYTSGSSGRPKAVMVPHRAYAQHCRRIAETYDIRAGDRVLLLAALTFDVAMDQIGATLLAGATVVVGPRGFWSPVELPDRLAESGVTHMEITPAYYREVLAALPDGDDRLARLRLMNVGSDVVTYDDAERWRRTGLPGRFLATYGPTEATITSLVHEASGDGLAGAPPEAAMPIGRPVPGTRAYVLDDHLQPAPIGVPGELCLGGVRVARGYRNQPRLTAERFGPDPFVPGARLYRTGDLARLRRDGVVEFLGRIDDQVKIRGFRVEPGEIESLLAAHPGVQAACVVARELTPGDRRLVAYLVTEPGRSIAFADLRQMLRSRLPEYMVPSLWMTVPALPMTTSGKVNRRALPAPDATVIEPGTSRVAPRTEVEQAIADVWSKVLPGHGYGVDEDFFDVGGHSLLLARVAARLEQLFGLDVGLRVLFEHRTIAAQAVALAELAELADAAEPVRPEPSARPSMPGE